MPLFQKLSIHPLTCLCAQSPQDLFVLLEKNSQLKYYLNYLQANKLINISWAGPNLFYNRDFLSKLNSMERSEALSRPAHLLQNWVIASELQRRLPSLKIYSGNNSIQHSYQQLYDYHIHVGNIVFPWDLKTRLISSKPQVESNHLIGYHPDEGFPIHLIKGCSIKWINGPAKGNKLLQDPRSKAMVEDFLRDPSDEKKWYALLEYSAAQMEGDILFPPLFLEKNMPSSAIVPEETAWLQESRENLQLFSQRWEEISLDKDTLFSILEKGHGDELLAPSLIFPSFPHKDIFDKPWKVVFQRTYPQQGFFHPEEYFSPLLPYFPETEFSPYGDYLREKLPGIRVNYSRARQEDLPKKISPPKIFGDEE